MLVSFLINKLSPCCIQGTYIANLKHKAHSIHLGENMKRTNNSDNRSLLGQIIKIEEAPALTNIPNAVNPPHVYQRVPPQVNEFGNEIVGQSQLAPNPPVNQLTSTNPSLVSATRSGQAPLLNSIPNGGNSPFMPKRARAQVNVFGNGNGNGGHSQPALNPSVNQLLFTNPRANSLPISPTINTINQLRLTPQMFPAAIAAISSNDLEAAMQIVGVKSIEELAYSTDIHGYTLLAYAAEHGRAKPIKVLLSKVLDPQQLMQKRNNADFTALMIAASFGQAKAITAMLECVGNPQQLAEQVDAKSHSALHLAAQNGHAAAITAILNDKSYAQQLAEQQDKNGGTALVVAAVNGDENVITAILKSVSNPQQLAEKQDKVGRTALMYAAFKGHVTVIASIFNGVSNPQQLVEQRDENGQTVLIFAMFSSASTLIITKILESVVDAEKLIFFMDIQGLNSFTFSLRQGNMEAALLLFDWTKDKASLLLKINSPNQPAAIKMMKPEIQDVFLKKYNEPNH